MAGMRVGRHPDNSVVCHARRLAGFAQEVFVTGAVLGVHCNRLAPVILPGHIQRRLVLLCEASRRARAAVCRQCEAGRIRPFCGPDRARHEEFGDLLAEGLYALLVKKTLVCRYMSNSMQRRGRTGRDSSKRGGGNNRNEDKAPSLHQPNADNGGVSSALKSLAAAEDQLDTITPDLCVNFLDAWRDDLEDWQKFSNGNKRRWHPRGHGFPEPQSWILVGVDAVGVNSPAARVTHKRDALLTSREQDPLSASVKDASVKELSCGLVFDSIIALHETGFADGRATVTVSPKVDLFRVPSSILG